MLKRNRLNINDSLKVYPISLGMYLLCTIVVMLIWQVVSDSKPSTAMWNQLNISLWLTQTISTLTLFVVPFLYCKTVYADFGKATGFKTKANIKTILISLLFVVGLVFLMLPIANAFIDWLSDCLEKIGLDRISTEGMDFATKYPVWDIAVQILVICIIAPICEEVLMRGVIAQGLVEKTGKIGASLLSATIFMLFHMNPLQTVHQFVLGFALSYAMLTTKSIWVPIAMHLFNNLLSVVLSYAMSEQTQQLVFADYWYLSVICGAIVVAVAVVLFIKFVPDKFKQEQFPEFEPQNIPQTVDKIDADSIFEISTASNSANADKSATQQNSQEASNVAIQTKRKVGAIGLVFSILSVGLCVIMWILMLFGVAV